MSVDAALEVQEQSEIQMLRKAALGIGLEVEQARLAHELALAKMDHVAGLRSR